ncbi:MAG TPA: 4-(cytidine 5'-diphospho)-2-C-methyl-D-erythritol kinase [Opitutaceae bacterium]|nr:4-(cytidine 5'-diphospho)-2-C-methyl-D-erythritol kinase [Opitutaceae bacterium]
MQTCSVSSPAKVNLFLAVTGKRADGYHDLVSVAAQLELGDTLRIKPAVGESDSLACSMPGVPVDSTNLVLRAAEAWRAAGGAAPAVRFVLEKRIPPQSGLGGGSSNAVAALRGLERIATRPLGDDALRTIAAGLGSDCAMFLSDGPVIMRGRGERVERLPAAAAARLREGELFICRPTVGVETAWAYGRLAKGAPDSYLAADEAEARVAEWIAGGASDALSFNSFDPVVFGKFVAYPVLSRRLADRHGLALRLSGSGSACFAWIRPEIDWAAIVADVQDAFGNDCLIERTRLANDTKPQRD